MAFHVGQKVVCVEDGCFNFIWGERTPQKGVVYTVRGFLSTNLGNGIRLAEIVNPEHPYTAGVMECAFANENFRPIANTKTGFAILESLLTPTPEQLEELV